MDEVHDVVKMITGSSECRRCTDLIESPDISVQNVTVSTDLHQELKLRSLAKSLQIPEYAPRVFPGLVYKGDDPNTVILLFDSGKMVCNGKSLEDVTVALRENVRKIVVIWYKNGGKCMPEVIVENIVASTSFSDKLDLDVIAQSLEEAEYEPEQFPGLVYRLSSPKTATLLFRSGKANCTGAKNIEDVRTTINIIAEKLKKLRCRGL